MQDRRTKGEERRRGSRRGGEQSRAEEGRAEEGSSAEQRKTEMGGWNEQTGDRKAVGEDDACYLESNRRPQTKQRSIISHRLGQPPPSVSMATDCAFAPHSQESVLRRC